MRRGAILTLGLLTLCLVGCCQHDPALLSQLTTTRETIIGSPGNKGLYDKFAHANVPAADVAAARSQVNQLVETADDNRGWRCGEPAQQAHAIQRMFESHVQSHEEDGKWSALIVENRKENMAEAFDIAINTQNRLKK